MPNNEPVKLFIVADPVTLKEPDTLTVPINVWVSFVASPNTFDPLLYIIEDVIVWTYNVWAVMLPPTTKFPLTLKLLVGNQKNEIHLCVVLSSDRGLCGGFNTNICRKAKEAS